MLRKWEGGQMSKLPGQTIDDLEEGDIILPINDIIFNKEVSSLFRVNGVELTQHNFTKLFSNTFTIIRETELDKALKIVEDSGKYRIVKIKDQVTTKPKENDWNLWFGGNCPVDSEAMYEVRYRDKTSCIAKASSIAWGDHSIVDYRLVK